MISSVEIGIRKLYSEGASEVIPKSSIFQFIFDHIIRKLSFCLKSVIVVYMK